MQAPFRIPPREDDRDGERSSADAQFREYLSRLLKMIPAEIVGFYMIGSGIIPSDIAIMQIIWIVICFILIIIVRRYGTADPDAGQSSQPVPVFISTVAFLIWVYWLGGPFIKYKIHIPWLASILILIWSFVIPIIYKGPKQD